VKIQTIEIRNFRCFADFKLDVDGRSIFVVGENGCGKSSLLLAVIKGLGIDQNFSIEDFRDITLPIEIVLTITNMSAEQIAALSEHVYFGTPTSLTIGIRVTWDAAREACEVVHGYPASPWKRSVREERESLKVIWLPSFRDPLRLLSFLGGASLVRRLMEGSGLGAAASNTAQAIKPVAALLKTEPDVQALLAAARYHLATFIPGVGASAFDVELSVVDERDLLKELELLLAYFGISLQISRQSSGLAQLSVFSFAAELSARDTGAPILLDEPEISLHPHAQRAVTTSLCLQNGRQALLATHSSNILERADPRTIVRLQRKPADVVATQPRGLTSADAVALSRYSTPETAEAFFARKVILVEGLADRLALLTLARRQGRTLDAEQVSVVALHGAGTIGSFLSLLGPNGLNLKLCGLCDEDKESDWIKKLEQNGFGSGLNRAKLASVGFFVSVRDLEDQLVIALGTAEVERVIDAQGEKATLSTFAGQPDKKGRPLNEVLRLFLQSRDRKVRYAPLLVDALDMAKAPKALMDVLNV
jgi:predicted ATPase